jgi:hypothetical protein
MSVDQPDVVDMVSISQAGEVALTVSDHLDWSNSIEHQTILQNKLNAYLAFVESGELIQQYPEARGRNVVLNVVFKHRPDRDGLVFMKRATRVIQSAGFRLQYELFAESCDN